MSKRFFDLAGSSAEMCALTSGERIVAAMLAFEAALAEAQAELGMIPTVAAAVIGEVCRADPPAVAPADLDAAEVAGNPAIPFVKALTAAVRARDPAAAGFVHYGSTSQDVIDTATMLMARDGFALIERDLTRLAEILAALAATHAETPMIGRTLLQQAVPITFGWKVLGWLNGVDRALDGLAGVRERSLLVQVGGPVGTLATFGRDAPAVVDGVARRLGLAAAPCWHTMRAPLAEIGCELAMIAGLMGKIGRDVTLLMQSEVGEVSEQAEAGRGGSSAMPHKRNPVASLYAVAAAQEAPHVAATLLAAMGQEHERAAGGWHAEWPQLPRLLGLAHRSVGSILGALDGLDVHEGRMRENLERAAMPLASERMMGLLVPVIGRDQAHHLVGDAIAEARLSGKPLAEVLIGARHWPGQVGASELAAALDAGVDIGTVAARVRQDLAARKQQRARRSSRRIVQQ